MTLPGYMVAVATTVATAADCRRRRVGAVLFNSYGHLVSAGVNAAPPGGGSCLAGECPRGLLDYTAQPGLDGNYGNCIAVHAEERAIAQCPTAVAGLFIAITCPPCPLCRRTLTGAGIRAAFYPSPDDPTTIVAEELAEWCTTTVHPDLFYALTSRPAVSPAPVRTSTPSG